MIVGPRMGFLDRILGRDADTLCAKGDKLRADGQWGSARHEFAAALRLLGDDERAEQVRQKLAECEANVAAERVARSEELAERGHHDQASAALRDALELTKDDEARETLFTKLKALDAAFAEAADAQEQAGEEPESGDYAGTAIEERLELRLVGIDDPVRAEVYGSATTEFQEAWLALEDGDGSAAVPAFQRLVQTDETGYALRELGRALLLDDRPGEAAEALQTYLGDEDPGDDAPASESLAEALWRNDDAEEAVGVLDRLLESRPERIGARVMLADIYLEAGQADDAVEIAEEGIALGENDSNKTRYSPLHHVLGAALAVLGRDQEARDSWETALGLVWRVDHETQELHFVPETAWALALQLLKMRVDTEKAVDLLKALQSQNGSVPPSEIQLAMGAGLKALGDLREARDALVAARTLMADDDDDGRARVDEALAKLEDSP